MRIGIIIGRIGDIDGVSLETIKWIHILRKMGHEVYVLTGVSSRRISDGYKCTFLPQLSFASPECEWEQKRAFYYPDEEPDELLEHLHHTSDVIAIQIFKWIMKNKIDTILPENSSALPCHLSMGMGIKKLVEHTGIQVVCHDHDFHWERGDRYKTPHKVIEKIIQETFPLQIPHAKHAVINSYSQEYLQKNFNIDSIVVPNVMNFNEEYGKIDDYNKDFRKSFGFDEDDILLVQVTRIVKRKGIETAIELIEKIDDKKVKLLVTGTYADDDRFGYYKKLVRLVKKKNLEGRIIFGHKLLHSHRITRNGEKVYSLSDVYANATASTYFSSYEGFGNAFVECVLARKPIFVNNYRPVYWPEIGSKGFKTVMIEDNKLTDKAVQEIDKIIHDPKLCKKYAEYNFELGKLHFSYEVLAEKLSYFFHLR